MSYWSCILDDPFLLFRTGLFFALTVYYVLIMTSGALRVARLLAGHDPRTRLLRTYVMYQVVSVRLTPVRGELLQCGLWTAVLLALWWLHGLV